MKEYNGMGTCHSIALWEDARYRYGSDMKTWANVKNWDIECDNDVDGLELRNVNV